MQTQRELAQTRRVIFRSPALVVIDLQTRLSGAAAPAAAVP
jgi:hypothetical protein